MTRAFQMTALVALALITGCTNRGISPGTPAGTIKTRHENELQARLVSHAASPQELLTLNSVLILPLDVDARVDTTQIATAEVYDELLDAAQRELGLKVFGESSGSGGARHLKSVENSLEMGKKVKADGVLQAKLENFIERSGSAVGGEPATVSFSMSVLRVEDGKELWSATYFFKDEALSQNLLKVGDRLSKSNGAGWKSARAVLAEGFDGAMEDLSKRRVQQFTK